MLSKFPQTNEHFSEVFSVCNVKSCQVTQSKCESVQVCAESFSSILGTDPALIYDSFRILIRDTHTSTRAYMERERELKASEKLLQTKEKSE